MPRDCLLRGALLLPPSLCTLAQSYAQRLSDSSSDNGQDEDAGRLRSFVPCFAGLVAGAAGGTIGVIGLTPGTDATRTANWDDTITGKRIWVLSANTGTGVGTITVRYIPQHDLA